MSTPNDNKRQQLISKLKELFQLDQPDLDFGLYRIMHAKSAEITQFLEKDLLPQVQAAYEVAAGRKPRELPNFTWVNTILGNVKTMINGAHKAFKFRKYHRSYLGAFAYRFNRRFNLRSLVTGLITHVAWAKPLQEWRLRKVAELAT